MWNPQYEMYGVIAPQGNNIRVYKDRYNYTTVCTGRQVDRAFWANEALVVYFGNGLVRRYTDNINYTTMRI